jgi:hypothetical protein
MSLALAAALAASTAAMPSCSWNRPGANPFVGNVVNAVDRYTDIPEPVRTSLKKRMAAREYDDMATITRDSIVGKHKYSELRDMHFGKGRLCRSVTRDKWKAKTEERGLVYCESSHCIIVPTVCRNVSRVTREPEVKGAAALRPDGGEDGQQQALREKPLGALAPAPSDQLIFDAPSAGGPTQLGSSSASGAPGGAGVVGGPVADSGATYAPGSGFPIFVPALVGLPIGAGTGSTPDVPGPVSPDTPVIPVPAAPIPEPSTWALLLAGVAMTGFMARRRKQRRPR